MIRSYYVGGLGLLFAATLPGDGVLPTISKEAGSKVEESSSAEPATASLEAASRSRSAHWSHISWMQHDRRTIYPNYFRQSGGEAQRLRELDWLASTTDWYTHGHQNEWEARNPTAKRLVYTVYLAVDQTSPSNPRARLAARFAEDMRQWFLANGYSERDHEHAFLHYPKGARMPNGRVSTGSRTADERKVARIWSSDRWMTNPGSQPFREYTVHRWNRQLQEYPGYTSYGIFVDEHAPLNHSYDSLEYPEQDDLHAAIVAFLEYIRPRLLGAKFIMLNTAEYAQPHFLDMMEAAGGAHTEYWNSPHRQMARRWAATDRMLERGIVVQFVSSNMEHTFAREETFTAGNAATPSDRGRLFELASYYMVVPMGGPIDRLLFTTYNANWDRTPFSDTYVRAAEFNVGLPKRPRSVYRRGVDELGYDYEVYGREYENALVLARPQIKHDQTVYDDRTLVNTPLPAGERWHPMDRNGRLGGPVSAIGLRNGEAAILVKGSSLPRSTR